MSRYPGFLRQHRTWGPSDVLEVATLNTNIRDQFRWLIGHSSNPMPHAIVRRTSNFALTSGAFSPIVFDTADRSRGGMFTVEDVDVDNGATYTPASALIAPIGGVVCFGGCVEIETAACNKALRLVVNTNVVAEQDTSGVGSPAVGRINISTVTPVSAGDLLELEAFHDLGTPLNALAQSDYSPKFWAFYVAVDI